MKKEQIKTQMALGAFLFLLSCTAWANIIYVNITASGSNDGSSWADAFTQLQSAISAAVAGDEIWVAAGTYKPTSDYGLGLGSRGYHFRLKNGVGIYGGFNGTESNRQEHSNDPNLTILSGDLNNNDNSNIDPTETTRQDNCYHVFYHPTTLALNNAAILDGFTITGGNANLESGPFNCGGGMCTVNSNIEKRPTINNCIFRQNIAFYYGGGMYNYQSIPTITNCAFNNNSAAGGGGLHNAGGTLIVTHCSFNGNITHQKGTTRNIGGAGLYNATTNATITDCLFNENNVTYPDTQTDYGGGGIYNALNSEASIIRCIFTNNSAGYGGGIYSYGSSPSITDCTFIGNIASGLSGSGGGIAGCDNTNPVTAILSEAIVTGCIFKNNFATGGGSGGLTTPIYGGGGIQHVKQVTNCTFNNNTSCYGGGICDVDTITNCVFYKNTAASAGGGIYDASTITNCILWNNTATTNPQLYSSTAVVSYCNIHGGYTGTGNINADPNFMDAANGDLRLQSYSPCVDSGDNTVVTAIATDLIGSSRVIDGDCNGQATVDMGAYEYYLSGDVNTTCDVDIDDLALWIPHWLQQNCTGPDNCGQADIDRDGIVKLEDFALLAKYWLEII